MRNTEHNYDTIGGTVAQSLFVDITGCIKFRALAFSF